MFDYYSSIILLSISAVLVLCILVKENARIRKEDKAAFYVAYLFVIVSALSEWAGVKMVGNENIPKLFLQIVKCADYILTPIAGAALVGPMKQYTIWNKILKGILVVNIIFQILAAFFGWMTVIDEHNHYTHGPLYPVYIAIYCLVIVFVIAVFIVYGKSFVRHNVKSLFAIIILVLLGIALQEILGTEIRTAYIALALGTSLLYIHYSEFAQLASDAYIEKQNIQITTDPLTGLLNRYAYAELLEKYDNSQNVPDNLMAFLIDINGLKATNDSMGHEAGDELIYGAAYCINKIFNSIGQCFRIGGDEFVVVAEMKQEKATDMLQQLETESFDWTGEKIKGISLAAGFASINEYPGFSLEKLVREADKKMYDAKKVYYSKTETERKNI